MSQEDDTYAPLEPGDYQEVLICSGFSLYWDSARNLLRELRRRDQQYGGLETMAKKNLSVIDSELKEIICRIIDTWGCSGEGVEGGFERVREEPSRTAMRMTATSSINLRELVDA